MTQEEKTLILLGVFIAAIVLANLLGTKIVDFGFFVASVGIFMYPITFLATDIVAEVCGRKKVMTFVIAGLLANAMLFLMVVVSIKLPPADRYPSNAAFLEVFNPSLRIIAASITAFFIAQIHDVMAFEQWKKLTGGKFLWLRNNASTIVSQGLDSVIFMFLAFYRVTPEYTVGFIFSMLVPYWVLKVIIAVADTPFVYLGVRWLRGGAVEAPT
jgi:uncharacterized integral membrane protein (TIGR00697 family)